MDVVCLYNICGRQGRDLPKQTDSLDTLADKAGMNSRTEHVNDKAA